jgi:thiamine-phosphate diphosphorylase
MNALASRLAVYVVSTETSQPVRRGHRDITAAALAGGATAVQLRAPDLTDHQLLPLAGDLVRRCRDSGALLIVNDRVEVAVASGADGVHLGQDDDIAGARDRLRSGQLLGISVRGVDDVPAAVADGADYLGVTVWATSSKPDAVPAGLEAVRAVAAASPVPVVGIGGITAANAAQVVEAGAAGVAVISAVARADDPEDATRCLVDVVTAARSGMAAGSATAGQRAMQEER